MTTQPMLHTKHRTIHRTAIHMHIIDIQKRLHLHTRTDIRVHDLRDLRDDPVSDRDHTLPRNPVRVTKKHHQQKYSDDSKDRDSTQPPLQHTLGNHSHDSTDHRHQTDATNPQKAATGNPHSAFLPKIRSNGPFRFGSDTTPIISSYNSGTIRNVKNNNATNATSEPTFPMTLCAISNDTT